MLVNEWGVYNANDELIRKFKCSTREHAASKVKTFWPKNYMFLEVRYLGKAKI
jgi:hypothetical protein